MGQKYESIYPPNHQPARSRYSPGIKNDMGDYYLIMISGHQARKNPETHAIDIIGLEEQFESAFENFIATLEATGATSNDIIQITIALSDLNDLELAEIIRDKWILSDNYVCSIIEMTRGTRIGSKIEIEGIAALRKTVDADITDALWLASVTDEARKERRKMGGVHGKVLYKTK